MSHVADSLRRYEPLVGDWAAFADACARPLPPVVWVNPLRRSVLDRLNQRDGLHAQVATAVTRHGDAGAALAARLEARGYGCEPVPWYPGAMRLTGLDKPGLTFEYRLGLYHVQEEVSLIPARLLAPLAGRRVLDLCAAPGGKTAQLAVALRRGGTIVANDVRVDRLRALRSNCERLGLLNVAMTAQDGAAFPLEAGPFDAILLDVPCSCEGNVRQGTGRRHVEPEPFLKGRSGLQATLLGRAWKLLAPGGHLVYATCTFAPEENEMVLDYALGEDAVIEPIAVEGLVAGGGVSEWRGRSLRSDCAHVARYWPHLNDTGGFAVAVVRKRADE